MGSLSLRAKVRPDRRSNRLRRFLPPAGVLTLSLIAGIGIAYACTMPRSGPGLLSRGEAIPAVQLQSTAPAPHGPFVLAGDVAGLRPGVAATLPVTVVNNGSQPYRVLMIDVQADGPRSCPAERNLRIDGYRYDAAGARAVVVPARGSAVVRLPIMLLDLPQNQNACLAARFQLRYTGLAEQEHGR